MTIDFLSIYLNRILENNKKREFLVLMFCKLASMTNKYLFKSTGVLIKKQILDRKNDFFLFVCKLSDTFFVIKPPGDLLVK